MIRPSLRTLFAVLEQQYLLGCQYFNELLDAAELEGIEDDQAAVATKFVLDALAPTNTLYGNPAALREAVDTAARAWCAARTCSETE